MCRRRTHHHHHGVTKKMSEAAEAVVFGVNGHLVLRNPDTGEYGFDRAGYEDAAGETVRPARFLCADTGAQCIAYKYDEPAMDASRSQRYLIASAHTDPASGRSLTGWVKVYVNPDTEHGFTVPSAVPHQNSFHLGDADTFHLVNTHPLAENMLEETYHHAEHVAGELMDVCASLGEDHVLTGDTRRHYRDLHTVSVAQELLPEGFTLDVASDLQGPVYAVPLSRMDKIKFQAIGAPLRRRPSSKRITLRPSGASKAKKKARTVTKKPKTRAPKPPTLPSHNKPKSDAATKMKKRAEGTLKARTGTTGVDGADGTAGHPKVKSQGAPRPKSGLKQEAAKAARGAREATRKVAKGTRKTTRKVLRSPEGKALTDFAGQLATTAAEAAATAAAVTATTALVDALTGVVRKRPAAAVRRVDSIPEFVQRTARFPENVENDDDDLFDDDDDDEDLFDDDEDDEAFPASKIGQEDGGDDVDESSFVLEDNEDVEEEEEEEVGVEDLDVSDVEDGDFDGDAGDATTDDQHHGALALGRDGRYRMTPGDVNGDGKSDYMDAFQEGYGKTPGGAFTVVSLTDPDGDGYLQDRDPNGNNYDIDVLGSDGSHWEAVASVGHRVADEEGENGSQRVPAWRLLYGEGVDPVDGDGTLEHGLEDYADPDPGAQTTFAILDADGDGYPDDEDPDGNEYDTDIVDSSGGRWEAVRYVGDSVDDDDESPEKVVVKHKRQFVLKYCPAPNELSSHVVVYKASVYPRGGRIVRIGREHDGDEDDEEFEDDVPSALGPGSVGTRDGDLGRGTTVQLLNLPRGPPPYLVYCRDSRGRPESCDPYFPLAEDLNGAEYVSGGKRKQITDDLRAEVKRNVMWLVHQHPKA